MEACARSSVSHILLSLQEASKTLFAVVSTVSLWAINRDSRGLSQSVRHEAIAPLLRGNGISPSMYACGPVYLSY